MRRFLLIVLSLFLFAGPALAKRSHGKRHHKASKHRHRAHHKKHR